MQKRDILADFETELFAETLARLLCSLVFDYRRMYDLQFIIDEYEVLYER
jgi:hypothetical protein